MKRTFAMILAVLMCLSAAMLAACGGGGKTSSTDTSSNNPTNPATSANDPSSGATGQPSTSKPVVETDDNGDTPDIMKELTPGSTANEKTHTPLETLPESATLVGKGTLPTPKNFASVANSSGSVAVTYYQFTNAVAQYLKNKDSNSTWTPETDYNSCFSPKFTYVFDGGVINPYYTLMEMGGRTIAKDAFAVNRGGVSILKDSSGTYLTQSTSWPLNRGLAEEVFQYRLSKFASTGDLTTSKDNLITQGGYFDSNMVEVPLYNKFVKDDDGNEKQDTKKIERGLSFTTSKNGRELLNKVKDAVAQGNAVVAQSYQNNLVQTYLTADTGEYGKSGQAVYLYAYNMESGKESFYFTIVGYDDNFTVTANGVTMMGAFQIYLNRDASDDGIKWITYDAFNNYSEYEGFAIADTDGLPDGSYKIWAVQCLYFTYWETDIVEGAPELYAEIELETTNRTSFDIILYRSNVSGEVSSYNCCMTAYSNNFGLESSSLDYFNPNGELNGGAVNGVYTVSFERLLSSLPTGTTYENYDWGIEIKSSNYSKKDANGKTVSTENPVILKNIVIKNKAGEIVAQMNWDNGLTITKTSKYFAFNFGTELANSSLKNTGKYTFRNVASGQYLLNGKSDKFGLFGVLVSDLHAFDTNNKCTCYFNITYTSKTNTYQFARSDGKYIIDIDLTDDQVKSGNYFTSGLLCKMIPQNSLRSTSEWKISFNDDGTITIFLTTEKGTNYALGIVDGAVGLVKATELTDNIKWVAEMYYDQATTIRMNTYAQATDTGCTVSGTVNSTKAATLKLKVYDATTGAEVAEKTVTVADSKYSVDIELAKGSYYVELLDSKDAPMAYQFIRYIEVK